MSYFKELSDFDYVSRLNDPNSSSDYIKVKNIFRRGKIREDLFNDFTTFTKYTIIGDERPDYVAYKFYQDSTLDWLVLHANNIVSVRDEWPLTQKDFENFLLDKYGSVEGYNAIKHYESKQTKDTLGNIILPSGVIVDQGYQITYRDNGTGTELIASDISSPVTYLDYELRLQDKKRDIYILKPQYVEIVLNDIEEIMTYNESSQYISDTLKKADNIKIK
jgi:hypothetical protein